MSTTYIGHETGRNMTPKQRLLAIVAEIIPDDADEMLFDIRFEMNAQAPILCPAERAYELFRASGLTLSASTERGLSLRKIHIYTGNSLQFTATKGDGK